MIKIKQTEPDVEVTIEELNRYRQEYQKAFSLYAGPVPTLEEFIRSKKRRMNENSLPQKLLLG